MLYEIITNALRQYMQAPLLFIYIVLMKFFLGVITLFFTTAILILLILCLTTFGAMQEYGTIAVGLSAVFLILFFLYFRAGYVGAMLNSFAQTESKPIHLRNYLNYAVENAVRFFTVDLAICISSIAVNLPIIATFIFLKIELISGFGFALLVVSLLLIFVVNFVFSFAYILLAVTQVSAVQGIKQSIGFIIKNAVPAFILYIMYTIAWITLFVPILNIVTGPFIYPVVCLAMIKFYTHKTDLHMPKTNEGIVSKKAVSYEPKRRKK